MISHRGLWLVGRASTLLTERRKAASSPDCKLVLSVRLSAHAEGLSKGRGFRRQDSMKKVLLTPIGLCWEEEKKQKGLAVMLIRDSETEEIVDEAVTSDTLAEKTGISQETARKIFQEAQAALERRLEG